MGACSDISTERFFSRALFLDQIGFFEMLVLLKGRKPIGELLD